MDAIADLRRLEDDITKAEGDGLHARWASGRYMLKLREDKKLLPRGVRKTLTKDLGVHPSELTARMKFAATFPTDEELADGISKFKSWYAITHQALTTTPRRATKSQTSRFQPMRAAIDNSDPTLLSEQDWQELDAMVAGVVRLRKARATLKQVA